MAEDQPKDLEEAPAVCTAGGLQYFDLLNYLTRRREKLGLSQGAVADHTPFTRPTLNKYENKRIDPSAEHLTAWAAALGVELRPVVIEEVPAWSKPRT